MSWSGYLQRKSYCQHISLPRKVGASLDLEFLHDFNNVASPGLVRAWPDPISAPWVSGFELSGLSAGLHQHRRQYVAITLCHFP